MIISLLLSVGTPSPNRGSFTTPYYALHKDPYRQNGILRSSRRFSNWRARVYFSRDSCLYAEINTFAYQDTIIVGARSCTRVYSMNIHFSQTYVSHLTCRLSLSLEHGQNMNRASRDSRHTPRAAGRRYQKEFGTDFVRTPWRISSRFSPAVGSSVPRPLPLAPPADSLIAWSPILIARAFRSLLSIVRSPGRSSGFPKRSRPLCRKAVCVKT